MILPIIAVTLLAASAKDPNNLWHLYDYVSTYHAADIRAWVEGYNSLIQTTALGISFFVGSPLLLNPLIGLGESELRAFYASIIIHDAGTPAFAHLFEYFLSERYDWNHESILPGLLSGTHHPDQRLHQIFQSQRIAFEKLCHLAKIDFDLVRGFISRERPYSKLIFGSLDFDNLDNVARMNWMLGERFDIGAIHSLANSCKRDRS